MTIALALGGGTARGWAHIGVLSVLAEESIAVGAAAGTSIGALAAVCLAADRLDVLEDFARAATMTRMVRFLDIEFGRGALLGGRGITRELARHFGSLRFEELPIPCATIAADLLTGRAVTVASGSVVEGIKASIALPGVFRAIERDGHLLVDGGLVANLPLEAGRALAPSLPLVAVDLMGDYAGFIRSLTPDQARRQTAGSIARTSFLMLVANQAEMQLALAPDTILIRPAIGHISTGAFHRAEELIAAGRTAASDALPRIRATLAAQKTGNR